MTTRALRALVRAATVYIVVMNIVVSGLLLAWAVSAVVGAFVGFDR
jgi:hypothetical protein